LERESNKPRHLDNVGQTFCLGIEKGGREIKKDGDYRRAVLPTRGQGPSTIAGSGREDQVKGRVLKKWSLSDETGGEA